MIAPSPVTATRLIGHRSSPSVSDRRPAGESQRMATVEAPPSPRERVTQAAADLLHLVASPASAAGSRDSSPRCCSGAATTARSACSSSTRTSGPTSSSRFGVDGLPTLVVVEGRRERGAARAAARLPRDRALLGPWLRYERRVSLPARARPERPLPADGGQLVRELPAGDGLAVRAEVGRLPRRARERRRRARALVAERAAAAALLPRAARRSASCSRPTPRSTARS